MKKLLSFAALSAIWFSLSLACPSVIAPVHAQNSGSAIGKAWDWLADKTDDGGRHQRLLARLGGVELTLAIAGGTTQALEHNLQVLRRRAEALGIKAARIESTADGNIVAVLPGRPEAPIERLENIFTAVGRVSFHLIEQRFETHAIAHPARVPAGSIFVYDRHQRPWVLPRETLQVGEHIIDAVVNMDNFNTTGQAAIYATLDATGAERMRAATLNHVGRMMALVYESAPDESQVLLVARIREPLGKRFAISGLDKQQAHDLAVVLRSGVLAAPVTIISMRQIAAAKQ